MKKKTIRTCVILLALVVLGSALYVGIGGNNVENKMWEYLEKENYSDSDIKSIEVKHSFANIILSYNEWIIEVVFEDEPTSVYKYTWKDGNIVETGVSGTTNEEDLKHIADATPNIQQDTSMQTKIEEAMEHDLSKDGELKVSESVEKDEVFMIPMDVLTNSEEIAFTNNSAEDVTIYLYHLGDLIRKMPLEKGETETITGLNTFPYRIEIRSDIAMQLNLTITD